MCSDQARDEKFDGDQYRQLLETAPDAIVVVGEDGIIELVNAQIETLFGYQRSELLGQPLEMLIPQRFRQAHGGHLRGFFSSPTVRTMGSSSSCCTSRSASTCGSRPASSSRASTTRWS
jgi:PAS domain-containing protein